jgi:hypothetical protein
MEGSALDSVHYLVIERFHDGDPAPVYRRFGERGRLMPEGLHYVSSWITEDLSTCYQLMENGRSIALRTVDRGLE